MLTTKNAASIVDSLAAREADKYSRMWDHDRYHHASPGQRQAPMVLSKLEGLGVKRLIDIGAGSGRLAYALYVQGFEVHMTDIVDNCLDPPLELKLTGRLRFSVGYAWSDEIRALRADATLSTDVLEHLPPERVDDTLDALAEMAPHGFHGICLTDDHCGKIIGETLHLSVHPAEWWVERFEKRFEGVLWRKPDANYVQIWY